MVGPGSALAGGPSVGFRGGTGRRLALFGLSGMETRDRAGLLAAGGLLGLPGAAWPVGQVVVPGAAYSWSLHGALPSAGGHGWHTC